MQFRYNFGKLVDLKVSFCMSFEKLFELKIFLVWVKLLRPLSRKFGNNPQNFLDIVNLIQTKEMYWYHWRVVSSIVSSDRRYFILEIYNPNLILVLKVNNHTVNKVSTASVRLYVWPRRWSLLRRDWRSEWITSSRRGGNFPIIWVIWGMLYWSTEKDDLLLGWSEFYIQVRWNMVGKNLWPLCLIMDEISFQKGWGIYFDPFPNLNSGNLTWKMSLGVWEPLFAFYHDIIFYTEIPGTIRFRLHGVIISLKLLRSINKCKDT